MRILLSLLGAFVLTIVLFYLMIGFISHDDLPELNPESEVMIDISQLDSGRDNQKKSKNKKKDIPDEPNLEINNELLNKIKAQAPKINLDLTVNTAQIKLNVNTLPILQKNWVQPSMAVQSNSQGLDDSLSMQPKSIRKVTPVSTRLPKIPKVAWDNKISGWVLLSFTVSGTGRVKEIRIMDASPKGIFEENAVLAATFWRYQGFVGHDRYVSQKIEFDWKNYPYNWD